MEHEGLTREIIGAAISLHRALGPGFLESIYEEGLALELEARGMAFRRQHEVRVFHRGAPLGVHRLDLLVADEIVVELKVVREVTDVHFAIVRSYLRAAGRRHGLILNFSGVRVEARRVIASDPSDVVAPDLA